MTIFYKPLKLLSDLAISLSDLFFGKDFTDIAIWSAISGEKLPKNYKYNPIIWVIYLNETACFLTSPRIEHGN